MKSQIKVYTMGVLFILFQNGAMAQEADHTMTGMDMNHDMKIMNFKNVTPAFQKQLEKVFNASLKMNDAFTNNDVEKVSSSAQNVKKAIGKVDMTTLSMEEYKAWITYQKTMYSGLKEITSASNIEDQKKYFALYNTGMYKSIKAFGIRNEVYHQYCPMANDNEGAYWVSDSKEIHNPYLDGKTTCGVLLETLN